MAFWVLTHKFYPFQFLSTVKLALLNSNLSTSLSALPTGSIATKPSGAVTLYPSEGFIKVPILSAFSNFLIINVLAVCKVIYVAITK